MSKNKNTKNLSMTPIIDPTSNIPWVDVHSALQYIQK